MYTSLEGFDYTIPYCNNITSVISSEWEQSNVDPKIICFYFLENDYFQIFGISFFLIYIHMGTYFMQYPLYAKFFTNFISMKPQWKLDAIKEEWQNRERINIVEVGFIGGLPIIFYFIVNAILHLIYIAIKIFVVLMNDGAYFGDPVGRYKAAISFKEFNSSKNLIEMGFYAHSILSAFTNFYLLYKAKFRINHGGCLGYFIGLIFVGDISVSIYLLCINWSLMILLLYQVSCGILVLIGCMLLFFIVAPVLFTYIYFVISLASCFGCMCSRFDKSKPMFIFAVTVGGGLASLSIKYLFVCATVSLSFLILGGPPASLFFVDLHSPAIIVVTALIISFFIGVGSIAVGFMVSFLRTNVSKAQIPNQKHERNSTIESETIAMTTPNLNGEIEIRQQDSHSNSMYLHVSDLNPRTIRSPLSHETSKIPEETALITVENTIQSNINFIPENT